MKYLPFIGIFLAGSSLYLNLFALRFSEYMPPHVSGSWFDVVLGVVVAILLTHWALTSK